MKKIKDPHNKTCRVCGITKSRSEFANPAPPFCKECAPEWRLWYRLRRLELLNPKEFTRQMEEGMNNIVRLREFRRLKIEDPEEYQTRLIRFNRDQMYRKSYNITIEQVEEQGEFQEWMCVICGVDILNRFHVDHDHQTNQFRALLCFNCNVGLGNFRDSITNLLRAAEYLQSYTDK